MKKSEKWFLVQRFLIIMFFIYWSVELINLFYGLVLVPVVYPFLGSQQIEITGNSDFAGWLLHVLLYFLAGFLPSGIREWVQRWIDRVMGNSLRIEVTSPLYSGIWGVLLRILIIGGIIGLLLLRLLPYVVGAFCYSRIVTRQFNKLLEEEKAQKLAADQKRNLLLSDIAHDIRTPITTICGYSKALSEGVVAQQNRQTYLDVIYAKAMRMDELISLLFEYVKLESEGFILHKEEGDLAELTRESTALLYTDFEDRGMSLLLEIPEEKLLFEMDRLQLGRAVTNLLTNALRYGKEGGRVLVRLKEYEKKDYATALRTCCAERTAPCCEATCVHPVLVPDFSRNVCVWKDKGHKKYEKRARASLFTEQLWEEHGYKYEITVADEGEPIDPDLAPHVFEPFTRGDRARSSQGGSGLGLSISKQIVRMHGGRIVLNQSFGEGYTKAFQIRLPDNA